MIQSPKLFKYSTIDSGSLKANEEAFWDVSALDWLWYAGLYGASSNASKGGTAVSTSIDNIIKKQYVIKAFVAYNESAPYTGDTKLLIEGGDVATHILVAGLNTVTFSSNLDTFHISFKNDIINTPNEVVYTFITEITLDWTSELILTTDPKGWEEQSVAFTRGDDFGINAEFTVPFYFSREGRAELKRIFDLRGQFATAQVRIEKRKNDWTFENFYIYKLENSS